MALKDEGESIMCSCAENCPHSAHCIAIYVYEKGQCWVLCDKDEASSPSSTEVSKQRIDSEVDIEIKAVPLSRVAEFLSGRFQGDLLVPASRLHEPIDFVAKKTAIESVLPRIGLVARKADG
jgi:hypothetical protein